MEYILIILCGILPICFKHLLLVRILCILALCVFLGSYLFSLQLSPRLATSLEYHKTQAPISDDFIDGAYKTGKVILKFQPEAICIFASLMILALCPVKKKKRASQRVDFTVKTPVDEVEVTRTESHP